jgi:hypothetical protein
MKTIFSQSSVSSQQLSADLIAIFTKKISKKHYFRTEFGVSTKHERSDLYEVKELVSEIFNQA